MTDDVQAAAEEPEVWIHDEEDGPAEATVQVDDIDAEEDTEYHRAPRFEIDNYGADYPVEMLVQRFSKDEIMVPDWQRDFVWSKPQASRLIESVLMGLPIPALFFAKDPVDGRMLVVDGRQRLTALESYFQGVFPGQKTKFRLLGVQEHYNGKAYDELDPVDQRQFRDAIIHSIVLKPSEDSRSGVYFIFERINTGGTRLSPQEIRECIELGDMVRLCHDLNSNEDWRAVFGKEHKRGKDRELILRFFAMLDAGDEFQKPLSGFLDSFAGKHRSLSEEKGAEWTEIFATTIGLIRGACGDDVFKPGGKGAVNAPAFEAIAVEVARLIHQHGPEAINAGKLATAVVTLFESEAFQEAIFDRTTNAYNVALRREVAQTTLAGCVDAA